MSRPARPAPDDAPWLGRGFFQFFAELKFNNERAWFQGQKERYVREVQRPFEALIARLAPKLAALDKDYVLPKTFRIHRDTRFSHDKSPYKTHAAAQFRHRAASADVHAPGYYLHLEPGDSFVGGGIWMPDAKSLKAIRDRIAAKHPAWVSLRKSGLPLVEGDALIRPPKGYPKEHPYLDDLKRRNFLTGTELGDRDVLGPEAEARILEAFQRTRPLVRFLCDALGL